MQLTKNTFVYLVSLIPGEKGNRSRMTFAEFLSSVKGGTQVDEDVAAFLVEEQANNYSERVVLLHKGHTILDGLDPVRLARVVAAIDAEHIDQTLEVVDKALG